VALATAAFALVAGEAFRPRPGYVSDFTQDWLSARDVLDGRPAYGDLPDALRRHLNGEPPQDFLRWNAHPPGAVLVLLPLARLEHADAFFAWNLLTFPLFVVAVGLVVGELGGYGLKREALAAGAVAVAGVTCYPLYHQVLMGQFNALLAFLLAVAWAADRNGRGALAGGAVGVAAAVKLFPAFLLLYFVAARRWRAAAATVVTALALTALSVGLLGSDAFRTYAREVVPAVSAKYATQWNNLTLRAFWLRLFDPTDESRVVALAPAPAVGHALAALARLAVVVLVGRAALLSAAGPVARRDRAFSAAVAGMILVSPIAWPHYLIMLVVPVGVLAAAPAGGRWALGACVAVLWLPETFAPGLVFGAGYAEQMVNHQHDPLTPAANLLVTSVQHYALLGLFLLALRRPNEPPDGPRTG
jgi:alpha-1,2-mannosyltransferase